MNEDTQLFTRREFVKGVALTTGGALVGSSAFGEAVQSLTLLASKLLNDASGQTIRVWGAPVAGKVDFLFIQASSNAAPNPVLDDVVLKWVASPQRALCFMAPIEIATVSALTADQLSSILAKINHSIATFFDGNLLGSNFILATSEGAQYRLSFAGNLAIEGFLPFEQLNFAVADGRVRITRSDSADFSFRFSDGHTPFAKNVPFIDMDLTPATPFVSGGFRVTLDSDGLQEFASRLVRLALYNTTPDHNGYALTAQRFRVIDRVMASGPADRAKACTVVLDLREGFGPWLGSDGGRLANSRVEDFPPSLKFESTYRTDAGGVVTLAPAKADLNVEPARFLLIQSRTHLKAKFTAPSRAELSSRVSVAFTPVGTFQISGAAAGGPVLAGTGNEPPSMVVGRHATDRVSFRQGDFLIFKAGFPSAYVDPNTGATIDDDKVVRGVNEYVHAGTGGAVHSAWATYSKQPKLNDAAPGVVGAYYCESKTDPLFQAAKMGNALQEDGVKIELGRMNLLVGNVANFIPMLPWGGAEPGLSDDALAIFEGLDSTHLSPARQLQVKAVPNPPHLAGAAKTRGVTPQGLLADIVEGNFSEVYFGSAKVDTPELTLQKIDPAEVPEGDEKNFRQKIQQALRASQSFFVAYTTDGLTRFDLKVEVDVFTFAMDTAKLPAGASIIVKLRSDRSLRSLLADASTWSCPEALNADKNNAADKKSKGTAILKYLSNLENEQSPPALRIKSVLDRKDWQGLLFVQLRCPKMPSILEALRPGIVDGDFFVHHAGIDLLPARPVDVAAAVPQPKRAGQAFGFIDYTGAKPGIPPTSTEKEPTPAYHFVVEALKVGFSNSAVDYFDCTVTVGTDHFFRDKLSAGEANDTTRKITLKGSYGAQHSDHGEVKVFSLQTDNVANWDFADSFIKTVALGHASFVVTDEVTPGGKPAKAELLFDGTIAFDATKQAWKSLFEVESVSFGGVGFRFEYGYGDALGFHPSFVSGKSAWKIKPKADATQSFLSLFPVKWTGFRFSIGKPADLGDLGFFPINLPGIDGLGTFDFAFEIEIDLGGLGKLAGDFKSIKLPALLGWLRASGPAVGKPQVCLGIQWPKVNGKLNIGIQQFIQIQADNMAMSSCDHAGHSGIALALKKLRLVILGQQIPAKDDLDGFAFVDLRNRGKTSWAVSYQRNGGDDGDWFNLKKLGFAHRISLKSSGSGVKELVDNYALPAETKDVCDLLSTWTPNDSDNWIVLGKFTIARLLEAAFLVDDQVPMYGLHVSITDSIAVGMLYQKLSDELGKFAGEIDLRKVFPPISFGAASLTLPIIRIEYYTDGGFMVDIGFPWENDFSRSARLEFGIYTGAGGLYFGRVNSQALQDTILKVDRAGYQKLSKENAATYAHTVLLAGFALEVGYGKGLSLGILSARVAITVFGSLEGAMGWRQNPKGDVQIWFYRGKVGVNLYIEGSVDFLIIRARAVIRASVAVGITKKRILAERVADGVIGYLTCPTTLFIEAILSVYAEATIGIGCVSVTLSFEFHATYTESFELDGESFDPIQGAPPHLAQLLGAPAPGKWLAAYKTTKLADQQPLELLISAVPTLGREEDFSADEAQGGWVNCLVVQTLISDQAFSHLCRFLAAWYFKSVMGREIAEGQVTLVEVRQVREFLKGDATWIKAESWQALRDLLKGEFGSIQYRNLDDKMKEMPDTTQLKGYVSFPEWPEFTWELQTLDESGAVLSKGQTAPAAVDASYADATKKAFALQVPADAVSGASLAGATTASAAQFVEYMRLLVSGLFGRIESTLISDGIPKGADAPEDPSVRQMKWQDVLAKIDVA